MNTIIMYSHKTQLNSSINDKDCTIKADSFQKYELVIKNQMSFAFNQDRIK